MSQRNIDRREFGGWLAAGVVAGLGAAATGCSNEVQIRRQPPTSVALVIPETWLPTP